MLGIVVSRADSASVHIGEHLRDITEWERREDDSRPDAEGGGTVYRTEGASLREFETRHLDLVRPAAAFDEPTILVFASRHAGDTGPLLTAHHTGNFGPAEHGGQANSLARACPNAHARVVAALDEHAPDGYDVGMECTHHGPSDVGTPSMFVEVGSGPEQWEDPAAARAVARAILALRGVAPDREVRAATQGTTERENRYRRHLVGLGGGHYAPRFERIVRETDWAVGHVAADWGLDALAEGEESEHADRDAADALGAAFEESRAAYALVDGDRPETEKRVERLGYRAVSETWVRETDSVPLGFVRAVERDVATVAEGLRFGEAVGDANAATVEREEWSVERLPGELLNEAFGIGRDATRDAVASVALAFETSEGGTRPTGVVVLDEAANREAIVDGLLAVLDQRYDSVEREDGVVVAREETFDPELARTLGVPEGPAFGRLADGQSVEVDGKSIPPEAVHEERERRFHPS